MKSYYITLTPEESEAFDTLMKEKGFKYHADFLRECVNAYAEKEICRRRHRYNIPPLSIVDEERWNFEGGEVVIGGLSNQIKVYFDEVPDIETRLNLRLLHFVPKEEKKEWTRIVEKYAIPKVRALLKPI